MPRPEQPDKLYEYAGKSTKGGGKPVFRVSNRSDYADILRREGHKNIAMVALPRPMTRADARKYLEPSLAAVFNQLGSSKRPAASADVVKEPMVQVISDQIYEVDTKVSEVKEMMKAMQQRMLLNRELVFSMIQSEKGATLKEILAAINGDKEDSN